MKGQAIDNTEAGDPIGADLLRQIVDNIPHSVFWKDRESVYLGCNSHFARDVGFSTVEIVGKTDHDLPWTAEQTTFFRACDRQVVESGEPMLDMTPTFNPVDGKTHWARSSKVPLRGEDGAIIGVLGIYADITDQKCLEQTLEQNVVEINRLNAALQRSNGDLRHFAHAVCHDLRSPLLSIEAGTEQLTQLARRHDAEDMLTCLTHVQGCVRRLDDMIRGLLRYSSVEQRPLAVERVPLDEVVAQIRDDLSAEIDDSGATFAVADLPAIDADRSLVYQLLLNLVENAIKFRRTDEPPTVRITGASDDGHHELRVSDNGVGFETSDVDRIFAPFERLVREGVSGSGIGLATVRRIAELHEATVRAESEAPDRGATFIVRWPRRTG